MNAVDDIGIAWSDATGQAELVRSGAMSARELVESAIRRIEALNASINAVVACRFEEALAEADVPPAGPFAGVPMLVKDLVATVAGARQTEGSRSLATIVAADDSELVRRYRAAGFVILGKTNTPEFGSVPTTEGQLFGPTRNPWDVTRITGGSSGGSAAAVASGMVPVAHGNDGGGSLRIPASCCGGFALKPTRARNPLEHEHGDVVCRVLSEHVITRSVRDSAAVLDATAGSLPAAGYSVELPRRPFAEEVNTDPGRLRIAMSREAVVPAAVHPDCIAALERTAELCTELGHEVVEAQPQIDGEALIDAWFAYWADFVGWLVTRAAAKAGTAPEPSLFEELTWRYYQIARQRTTSDHLATLTALGTTAAAVFDFMKDYDLWLTPTLAQPPLQLGAFRPNTGGHSSSYVSFSPFTRLANITGQPAMSVPLHWSEEQLPIGTQFAGHLGAEATLFRLAGQLERAAPWHDRRPSVITTRGKSDA